MCNIAVCVYVYLCNCVSLLWWVFCVVMCNIPVCICLVVQLRVATMVGVMSCYVLYSCVYMSSFVMSLRWWLFCVVMYNIVVCVCLVVSCHYCDECYVLLCVILLYVYISI